MKDFSLFCNCISFSPAILLIFFSIRITFAVEQLFNVKYLNLLQSFQWMSRVLQAVDSIHQVGLYCLALVPPNYLPKTPLGGIHLSECKRRFLEGTLHPANVLLCPHTCVTNLPKPREVHSGNRTVVWLLLKTDLIEHLCVVELVSYLTLALLLLNCLSLRPINKLFYNLPEYFNIIFHTQVLIKYKLPIYKI